MRKDDAVALETDATQHDFPQRDTGTPTYDGLPLASYVSVMEMLNPMHRLWSDGRWNKITLAHGCYWKKCSFCDVSLDYIGRYDRPGTDVVLERIRALIAETGQTGFHLVDEAAPPAGMRALAKRLLAENLSITWWGNIRFEKTFTPELCGLLAEAGCVAVSGGLEVASNRLLGLMKKGVTVEQVARVTRAFTDAGIMVHAYLMYGFPSETVQETIDALERVRQLFEAGCIQSAYWHRFSATAHSPVGLHPEQYGITLRRPPEITFAHNDLDFDDPVGADHDFLGAGLRKALYNYMLGVGPRRRRPHLVRGAACRRAARPQPATAPPSASRARNHRRAGAHRPLPRAVTSVLIALNKPFGVDLQVQPGARPSHARRLRAHSRRLPSRPARHRQRRIAAADRRRRVASAHRESAPQAREDLLGAGRTRADGRRASRAAQPASTSAISSRSPPARASSTSRPRFGHAIRRFATARRSPRRGSS